MDILFFITDNLLEILLPLVLLLAFITLIYIVVNLFLDNVKDFRKNNDCKEGGDDEAYIIQKAIIMLGNEKIEVEVDCYEIDYTTIKIEGKDGELYLTDIKNVLLSSN